MCSEVKTLDLGPVKFNSNFISKRNNGKYDAEIKLQGSNTKFEKLAKEVEEFPNNNLNKSSMHIRVNYKQKNPGGVLVHGKDGFTQEVNLATLNDMVVETREWSNARVRAYAWDLTTEDKDKPHLKGVTYTLKELFI